MRKLLFLLSALYLFIACSDNSELIARIEALEQAEYREQMDALESSVKALENVDNEIRNTIQSLQDSDTDMATEIAALKDYDQSLNEAISELKDLLENSPISKDWLESTFVTLEQYNAVTEDLKELNELIAGTIADMEGIIAENYRILSDEIAETKSAIEDWVEATLELYCTDEEVDEKISGLKSDLETLQENLEALEARLENLEDIIDNITRDFRIEFSDNEIGIFANETVSVGYTVIGVTESTMIKAFAQNGWSVKVVEETNSTGYMEVTAPGIMTEDEIVVLVYDGEYRSIMATLDFVNGVITPSKMVYEVDKAGGVFEVTLNTNVGYNVNIPAEASAWLTFIETKSMRTDILTFSCTANEGDARYATVSLVNNEGVEIGSFNVYQTDLNTEPENPNPGEGDGEDGGNEGSEEGGEEGGNQGEEDIVPEPEGIFGGIGVLESINITGLSIATEEEMGTFIYQITKGENTTNVFWIPSIGIYEDAETVKAEVLARFENFPEVQPHPNYLVRFNEKGYAEKRVYYDENYPHEACTTYFVVTVDTNNKIKIVYTYFSGNEAPIEFTE